MKIETVFNVIITEKLEASAEFYIENFDFEIIADTGWYKHLKHSNGTEIGFMEPNHPSQPPLFQTAWNGKGLILSFQVENADEAYQKIKSQNISIAFELTTEEWGQKHFAIIDPNGVPVDIVEQL